MRCLGVIVWLMGVWLLAVTAASAQTVPATTSPTATPATAPPSAPLNGQSPAVNPGINSAADTGQTLSQALPDTTEPGELPRQDTLISASSETTRLGISTFAFRNFVMASLGGPVQQVRATLWQDFVYNNALRQQPFVTKDIIALQHYRRQVWPGIWARQQARLYDYGATGTRLAELMAGLEVQKELQLHSVAGGGVAGLVSDRRGPIENSGLGTEGWVLYNYKLPDTTGNVGLQAAGGYGDIHPRQRQYYQLAGFGTKQFGEDALIEARAGVQARKVEDYLSGSVQSIVSDTTFAQLNLYYNIYKWLSLRSGNLYQTPGRNFAYRPYSEPTLRQNVYYNQTEMALRQELLLELPGLVGSVRYEYKLRERSYGIDNNLNLARQQLTRALEQEKAKDIREATTAWYTQLRYMPSRRHEWALATIAQLLRVDTYSSLNQQDRDEVLYNAELGYKYYMSRLLRLDMKTSASFRQLVYITSQQSIENFKERILRLEPGFRWQPGKLIWAGYYSLFVTYNVRDFPTEQDKNRSNRIFLTTHNLQYSATRRDRLSLDFTRRENRLGRLDWEAFRESPIDTVVLYDVTIKNMHNFSRPGQRAEVLLGLGYRYLRQNRNNVAGVQVPGLGNKQIYLSNILLQHGPQASLLVNGPGSLRISAEIWLQFARVFNQYRQSELPYIGASQSAEELDRKQRNLYPYFTVNISYGLYRPRMRR